MASEDIVSRVSSVGSFLDGGAVHPLQEEAVKLINPETVTQQAGTIQQVFKQKRDYVLNRLQKMGFIIDVEPEE